MVSEVAFGGVEIGMPYANQQMPTESESLQLLHKAVDCGINFFDTARAYGRSEEIMGKAFRGRRSEIVIATKAVSILDQQGHLPSHADLAKIINSSLEESLKALSTDYVDIFMLHQGNEKILKSSSVEDIMSELMRTEKIRALGVSTYGVKESGLAIDREIWDVIQLPFNLLDQSQESIFEMSKAFDIGIVARSVLLRGLLNGESLGMHPALSQVQDHIDSFHALVDRDWPDLPTLATKFALSFSQISSVLLGLDKMEYLDKAIETADGLYLEDNQLTEIQAMRYPDSEFLNLNTWVRNKWLA